MSRMTRGYQKGTPDAFRANHTDEPSITHGNPHHIWSYVAGIHDGIESTNASNCPCAANPGPQPPLFSDPTITVSLVLTVEVECI